MDEDKEVARQTVSAVVSWWNEHASTVAARPLEIGEEDSPVHLVWKAPLYRVRLGPFASREEAEKVRAAVQSSFPDAFVSPERLRSSQ